MNEKTIYERIFAIHEIRDSGILKALFYAILGSFFVTFYRWVEYSTISVSTFIKGAHVCPPRFPNCGEYYFLESLPYGYTQSFFYLILFLVLLCGLYAAVNKDWSSAHKVILATFIWKVLYIFFFTYGAAGNFDYYDMGLAFVWLFLREKEYFAKVVFVTLYFMASTIKIHEGWILGNYLTSTIAGAPFIGDGMLPVFTNLVIIMQIVGAWFLFSKNVNIQKLVFVYFFLFHAYSGIIVTYRYITISIPALVILFGHNFFNIKNENEQTQSILRLSKKSAPGYVFVVLLLASQFIGILIPGEQKKTLEGNYYGLYMFEANHQCTSRTKVEYVDGTERVLEKKSSIANNRCDPYAYLFKIQTQCERNKNIARIQWTFDHSVNGHRFERIIDEENACTLVYKGLKHNDWIKLDGMSEVMDFPVYKNGYAREPYPESYRIPTAPRESDSLDLIVKIYWVIWITVLAILIFLFIKRHRRDG